MSKVKFNWSFEVTENEEFLDVNLNDGLNCSIPIFNSNFHEHLSNKLQEIMEHQFEYGTKTTVSGLKEIDKAKHIYNADFR